METRFREAQQFRQPLLWAITLAIAASATAYAVGVLFQKFVIGAMMPRPPSVTIQMMVALSATGMLWVLTGVLYAARLLVHVFEDAVVLRYAPFTREVRIELWQIRSAEALTYRPITDLGGWGIKAQENGRICYTVKGTRAVLLRLQDGSEILIGTQRPTAMVAAIEAGLAGGQRPEGVAAGGQLAG